MPLLDRLERLLGRYAVRHLALYLVIGQVFVLFAVMLGQVRIASIDLVPALVTEEGEWWRLITFLLIVPVPSGTLGFVFAAFGWYIFYLMGDALEGHWGAFRFNAFLVLGVALTVVTSFLAPYSEVSNLYILGSVFLAFAWLYPDFELLLFFILPVKIKWLAVIAWALNLVQFVRGDLADRLQIGASVAAWLAFFGGDLVQTLRSGRRLAARRAERRAEEEQPRHTCHVCGRTDRSHPQLDFRYCSKCAGDQCYCPEHIHNHAHVIAADDAKAG
ncbi:MAG: hypothetical protein FJ399_09570 [Verrucomicrobia bacterium]|nr:hypothetical protein [Verrucomicrobiota bacterium]